MSPRPNYFNNETKGIYMHQRMCDYLTAVIDDLDGQGITVTDNDKVLERLSGYWAEIGEVLYVVAVLEDD